MTNTLYNVLIFDVYNVFHRAFWKHENLTKVDGKLIPIDGICNFFSILNSYIEKFGTKDCKCYFLLDNAKTTILRRKELDEDYKKNRKENEMPQEFYDALNLIELILKFYRDGILYRKQGIEADDYVQNLIDLYIIHIKSAVSVCEHMYRTERCCILERKVSGGSADAVDKYFIRSQLTIKGQEIGRAHV